MKKTLIAILLSQITFGLGISAQIKVTGNMSIEADSMTITLINSDFSKQERLDKVPVTNGTFTYSADISEARQLLIYPTPREGQMLNGYINIFVLPNSEVTLTGTVEEYHLQGSTFYSDYDNILTQRRTYTTQLTAINDEFKQGQAAGLDKDSLRQAIMPRYQAVQQQLSTYALQYIQQHPTQDAAVTLISSVIDTETAYNALSEQVKNGPFANYVTGIKKQIQDEAKRKEASKLIVEGKPAPDFTLSDLSGKPLALSHLRGKYVVLDFWGSWCVWCIRGLPKMKEYYQKYSGKFEILGIDCNDTDEKWREAVQKHEIPWLHVYNPRTSDLLARYAIEGFPTKIVVDPQGNIAKVIVGEDPSFYEYLDTVFK